MSNPLFTRHHGPITARPERRMVFSDGDVRSDVQTGAEVGVQVDIHPDGGEAERERITVAEAARRLGRSRTTIYEMITRGDLETVPRGNRGRDVLWPPERLPDVQPDAQADASRTSGLTSAVVDMLAEKDAELARLRDELTDAKVEAAELRGRVEELRARLAEAIRPGPVARLIEALAARLTGRRDSLR